MLGYRSDIIINIITVTTTMHLSLWLYTMKYTIASEGDGINIQRQKWNLTAIMYMKSIKASISCASPVYACTHTGLRPINTSVVIIIWTLPSYNIYCQHHHIKYSTVIIIWSSYIFHCHHHLIIITYMTTSTHTLSSSPSDHHHHTHITSTHLFILFLCLFLSVWPFQLYFIPKILAATPCFLTLFFLSYLCLIGPFNYISLSESLLQTRYDP